MNSQSLFFLVTILLLPGCNIKKQGVTTLKVKGIEMIKEYDSTGLPEDYFDKDAPPCFGKTPVPTKKQKLVLKKMNTECEKGKIFIWAKIGKSGRITEKRIMSGLCPELDKKALEMVSGLTFEPLICDGDTFEATIGIPVNVK